MQPHDRIIGSDQKEWYGGSDARTGGLKLTRFLASRLDAKVTFFVGFKPTEVACQWATAIVRYALSVV